MATILLGTQPRDIGRPMLDLMRRQSYLIYLVFGGIIFIFAVNFGPGSSGCAKTGAQDTSWAAKVDGDVVRQREFVLTYSRQLDYLHRLAAKTGQEFDQSMVQRLGLSRRVIDQLVERKLLAKEAHRRGLQVSDDELLRHLREQYGVKDVTYETYENWVTRTFETTVAKFEDDTRDDIAASHMARLVNDTLTVGDSELKEIYGREHDRAKIDYVRFPVEASKMDAPSEKAVQDVLAHEEKAVEEFYNQDLYSYRTPAQAHAHQIVRKLASDASEQDVANAQQALLQIKNQLAQGADFAQIAQQNSQDEETAAKGGDMGWVTRGQTVRALDDAIFRLQVGGITDEPVRTPLGLHLVKVDEMKPPKRKEFGEVKQDAAVALLKTRTAETKAKAQAEALLAQLKAGKALNSVTDDEDFAKTSKLPIRRATPWMLRSDEGIPRIGQSKELHAEIFGLKPESPLVRSVYKVNDTYYVAQLKDREHPDMSKFKNDEELLREQALDDKRNRVLKDWLTRLRRDASVQTNSGLMAAMDAQGAGGGT